MPVILVATDFSNAGDNAAQYGAALAHEWGYDLQLLHSYFMPVSFNDPGIPVVPIDDLRDINNTRMESTATMIRNAYADVSVTTRIEYGDIGDILEEVIEDAAPKLLIIGSHGAEEDSFWTGNTAAELLRSSKTPILAVPDGYHYAPVRKVCIAVDAAGMPEDAAFSALQDLLKRTGASLDILHVAKEKSDSSQDRMDMPLPAFEDKVPVNFHVVSSIAQVDDEIAAFTQAKMTDWLIVIPHHYSFWESLFHKSHTKAMVHKSGIPVLALH